MLSQISSIQFSEWRAYADLEPFDQEREDARAASIASTIANANRNTKKRPRPFEIKDFMLRREIDGEAAPKKGDWRFMRALAQAYAESANEQAKKGKA